MGGPSDRVKETAGWGKGNAAQGGRYGYQQRAETTLEREVLQTKKEGGSMSFQFTERGWDRGNSGGGSCQQITIFKEGRQPYQGKGKGRRGREVAFYNAEG